MLICAVSLSGTLRQTSIHYSSYTRNLQMTAYGIRNNETCCIPELYQLDSLGFRTGSVPVLRTCSIPVSVLSKMLLNPRFS